MTVHVAADDVHLLGMGRAHLGAEHFLPLTRRVPFGVDATERGVGLQGWVRVPAGAGTRALHDVAVRIVAHAVDGASIREVRVSAPAAGVHCATSAAAPTA